MIADGSGLQRVRHQEAAEAIGVTFLMNGGPATVYGARAFAAFREFYDQHAAGDPLSGQEQPTGYEHGIRAS